MPCSPYLYLPVTTARGIEYAAIPTGMSEEYFDFMVMSLDFHAKNHPTFVIKETTDMGNPITEKMPDAGIPASPENAASEFQENAKRIHGGAGQSKQPDASTPLDDASC